MFAAVRCCARTRNSSGDYDDGGTCAAGGYTQIGTAAECATAGLALGFSDTTVDAHSSGVQPVAASPGLVSGFVS